MGLKDCWVVRLYFIHRAVLHLVICYNLGDYTGTKAPCCCVGDGLKAPYVIDSSKCGGTCDTSGNECRDSTPAANKQKAKQLLRNFAEEPAPKELFFTTVAENGGSCLQKCQGGKSDANCTVSKLSDNDSQAFKDLYSRMTKEATFTIAPSELQSMFHLETDPCDKRCFERQ